MSPVRKPSTVGLRNAMTAPATPAAEKAADLPPIPERRPRPEKPVRFTLDLDRPHHQFLKEYATRIEASGASAVMRALLDELRDDPQLASRVRDRIWQS